MSRLAPLALVGMVVACKPSDGDDTGDTDTIDHGEVGALGADLPVLDAFRTDARIDGRWRWTFGETERRQIVDGALVMETRAVAAEVPFIGTVNNSLRTPTGQRIDQLTATFVVEDFEAVDSQARTWIGLYYQPVEDRATDKNLIGIRVTLRAQYSSELAYAPSYFKCVNVGCSNTAPMPDLEGEFPWDVGAPLGQPVELDVAYDETSNEFRLTSYGYTATLDASAIPGFDPADFLYAEIRTQAQDMQAGDESRMRVRVGEVYADGALYDDFATPHIDTSKWHRGDILREIDEGALVLAVGHTGPNQSSGVPLRYRQAVREMAAHVTVEEYSDAEGTAMARVGGAWFWDGTSGDGLGELNGAVFGYTRMTGTEAGWYVARCTTRDCTGYDLLGEGVLAEVAVGETHQLYAAFDGTLFTFQVDDQAPASFSPVAAGSVPWGVPWFNAFKGVDVKMPPDHVGTAYIRARFDDVRTWPTPTVSFTAGDSQPFVWRTTGAEGAGDWDGLSALVAFGPDPDDDSRAILRAKTGDGASESRCESGCGLLELNLPYNADSPWLDGQTINGFAKWVDPSNGVVEEGAAAVTFTSFDEFGTAPSIGTFTTTLASGVSGSFDTTFLPFVAPPPTRGTRVTDPIWVSEGCVDWMFCDFSAPTDRATYFAVSVEPSSTRVVRGTGGDAVIELRDSDRNVLCSGSAGMHTEFTCRGQSAWPMYVDVQGLGGTSPRVKVPISRDYVDFTANSAWDGTTAAGEQTWFRVRHDGTSAIRATARPHNANQGGLELVDREGMHQFGNGWCCTGEGSVHETFVPKNGNDEFWLQLHADQEQVLTIETTPSSDGTTALGAVPHETPLQYNAFNYAYGPYEELYVTFTPEIGGAFEINLDGMNWTPYQAPIGWTLISDPLNPDDSIVTTDRGPSCPSEWSTDESRYLAQCWVVLEDGVPYTARIEETGGVVGGTLASMWVAAPWEHQEPLVLGTATIASAPSNTSVNHVTLSRSDRGYRTDLDLSSATGFDGCVTTQGYPNSPENRGHCFGGSTVFNEGWRAPGDVLDAVVKVNLWGGSQGFPYRLLVTETGTGRTAASPFEIAAGTPLLRDIVDAREQVFYAITGAATTQSVTVRSSNYGGVNRSPVDWLAYTNPADPTGSAIRSCTANQISGTEFTYNATCSVTSSVPYYLRLTERNGVDDVHIEVLAAVN